MTVARFVVLRHDSPRGLHWDLMLEAEGVLRTWALAEEPVAQLSCEAERLPDHRLAYLDYEGEISDGRGSVTRCDAGEYFVCESGANQVVVSLKGTKLRGTATLARREDSDQRWRFSFATEGTAASGLSDDSATGEPSVGRSTV